MNIVLDRMGVHAIRVEMYVRTISRNNKDGSTVTYVQLAHNDRDPKSGQPKENVLHTFGQSDDWMWTP